MPLPTVAAPGWRERGPAGPLPASRRPATGLARLRHCVTTCCDSPSNLHSRGPNLSARHFLNVSASAPAFRQHHEKGLPVRVYSHSPRSRWTPRQHLWRQGCGARPFPYLQQLGVEQQGVRRLRVVVTLLVQITQFVQVPEARKHSLTLSPGDVCRRQRATSSLQQ